MTTITIPRSSEKNKNLVAVPRDEYEAFIEWLKREKSTRTFTPSSFDKKALQKARRNLRSNKYLTANDLERDLGSDR